MNLTKEYTYNTDRPVLLVCDYYETSQIPMEMLALKDNIALFPIANVPLIELILTNLLNQNYTNVIIAGTKITKVVQHIMKTDFVKKMDFKVYKPQGNSLGDILREFDQQEFEFKNLLVLYANSFTNIPLKHFLKKHKKSKRNLLSLFAHNNKSNDLNVHVYATINKDIVYYDKITNGVIDSPEVLSALYKYNSVNIDTGSSSPTMAFISNQVFSIFTENFDFHTFGDLISGVLATKLYDQAFQIFTGNDFHTETDIFHSEIHSENMSYYENVLVPPKPFYGKEIVTLLDYYNFNKDLADNPKIFSNHSDENIKIIIVKGEIVNDICVCDSFVGESSLIEASIYNSIVWDNCIVKKDLKDHVFISDDHIFDIFHLESSNLEALANTPHSQSSKTNETFFDDLKSYLLGLVTTAKFYNSGLAEVYKQISLLRIVWNASQQEVVEAFAYFFIDIIDVGSLENSLSQASNYFGIVSHYLKEQKNEELLLEVMYDCLSHHTQEIRVQIFFNYAYLLVQDKVIDKSVMKKYSKLYKAGKL